MIMIMMTNIYTGHYMKTFYGELLDLMCSKENIHMNGLAVLVKIDYVGIPPIEAFHSSLKQEAARNGD